MRDLLCHSEKAAEINKTRQNGSYQPSKVTKKLKQYSKPRWRKEPIHTSIDAAHVKRKRHHRRKTNYTKKKTHTKITDKSSDESEDEYRYKRRKLSDAVVGRRGTTDKSSLSARLKKMLHKSEGLPIANTDVLNMYQDNNNQTNSIQLQVTPPMQDSVDEVDCGELKKITPKETVKEKTKLCGPIELLSSDDDVTLITDDNQQSTVIESVIDEPKPTTPVPNINEADKDSDEDLAKLRQQVLSTKCLKVKLQEPEIKLQSEGEDSDTTELRLICLKSTLLKRAMEMKQKQKMKKRLSQSQSTLEEDIYNGEFLFTSKNDSTNNTDTESMDMDMGSDVEEKIKDGKDESLKKTGTDNRQNENHHTSAIASVTNKEEELEEDEDLLRAKLLTSLSKNLPNLVSPELLNNTIDEINFTKLTETEPRSVKIPEGRRFIIKLGESDSEGEHEATKNLTKMHMKLSEQTDFQQKLDLLLKSTRMQVENTKLPDVVQNQTTPKKPEKFVAKVIN